MVDKEQINKIITDVISEKSYSHKPHLASLPYDHNTNDVDKLKERKEAIEEKLKREYSELEKLEKDLNGIESDLSEIDSYLDEHIPRAEKEFKLLSNNWEKVYNVYDKYRDKLTHFIDSKIHYEGNFAKDVLKNVDEINEQIQKLKGLELGTEFYEIYKNLAVDLVRQENFESSMSLSVNNSPKGSISDFSDISGVVSATNIKCSPLKERSKRISEKTEKKSTLTTDYESTKKQINKKERIISDYEQEYDRTQDHIDRVTE